MGGNNWRKHMWQQQTPISTPQQSHLPIGAIPIHDAFGQRIAMVLPQCRSGYTQTIANAIERLPAILAAARHLELLLSPRPAPEISVANAARDLRRALGGIELEPTP